MLLFIALDGVGASTAGASEEVSCLRPRLADVGWTDITITTSLTSQLLEGLGYEPQVQMLGTDIIYRAMKNGEIDIFLGTWLPGLREVSAPYYADGSIETVRTNLTGAKFTLAVPTYVRDAGVHSFNDLSKYKEMFGGKIYGLEPGGNQPIEEMIKKDAFDLGGWDLVESSEAGMLSQVQKAVSSKGWIVFLGWEPHPMNRMYEISYLSGGDTYYGKDYGAAIVNTDVRRGFAIACPNVGALLNNLKFDVEMESELMEAVLNGGILPPDAVRSGCKSTRNGSRKH
ncbi:glycine betaine ABC transporter substrate-binding protein [Ferirhizobium litorale]|uniref:Glycine/betaine ABC transporter substrate-binding protein n=1 Tax=Ferirhizobium litorale TaxID=2927786 RepID=A0AAE3U246_9HYPH|nr:glycine betaine ABC transporter substrate-binding protein [Fererhizobium litorale]MDI7920609.1 glycine/betaine ABC transporter substrate-binding protein [Fererhizobium litorale]